MPNVFVGHSAGDTLPAVDWQTNWNLVEASFGVVGPYIQTGLVPTAGSGLAVNVSSGNALIGANIVKSGAWTITALANGVVNDLYMLQNGTGTSLPNPSSQPANSVKLGTATTAGGVVTSVNTLRSSGRQLFVRPENQVPGAVGSMGSINLANWAAAAADNVPLFGVLPAGAVTGTTRSIVTKTANYTALYTDDIILCNANGGAFTITLPTAVGHAGSASWTIKKTDSTANGVTITTTSGQTIDSVAPPRIITAAQATLTLISDGSNWIIV